MPCEAATRQFADWLAGELPAGEQALLDAHIDGCPACRRDLAATRQVWQRLGAVPTPDSRPAMRANFYAMLDQFVAAEATPPKRWWVDVLNPIRQVWSPGRAARFAYSLLLLCVGVGAGYWLQRQQSPDVAYRQQIDTLSSQVQEMRQMMLLSLLENPSATERLRAVSYTKDIGDVDGHVIDALLMTLNNDPNVNVRLVTLEALADLARDPRAREGLVQSLTRQESPLVQVALADVMVKLQEKRSLKPLRQMLRQEGINALVKTKLEQTIKDLS